MGKNNGLSVKSVASVTGSGVRIRETPVNGAVWYSANKGDSMYVSEKKDNQSDGYCWYKVANRTQSGKKEGYIRGDYLSGTAGGGSFPGVTGNGPNATVNPDDIRNGKVWKEDTKTTHPLIKVMQSRLNSLASGWGTDVPQCGTPDGIFGSRTTACVRWFQGKRFIINGVTYAVLSQDGVVGPATMKKITDITGWL